MSSLAISLTYNPFPPLSYIYTLALSEECVFGLNISVGELRVGKNSTRRGIGLKRSDVFQHLHTPSLGSHGSSLTLDLTPTK